MRAPVRGCQDTAIAVREQFIDHGIGYERQVAGKHQPRRVRQSFERRADADDGAFARCGVDDHRISSARRV